MTTNQSVHRLFFALWPSSVARESVIEASLPVTRRLDGRTMQPHNLHITLHFIGQVSAEVKACMHEAAQTVNAESFSLNLDRFGHFSRAKILWMGPSTVPAELGRLHDKLGEALSGCGYECDKRPYSPHVTLMRKCKKIGGEQQGFSIPWAVNEFVLVESVQDVSGVNYQVIERYPLS
jgi:2'-5' RNA ligase